MSDTDNKFEAWGILELFGHLRLAGLITEQTIGSGAMIRIDIPAIGELPAYTRYFGNAAVYGITPTSESIARALAERLRAQPIQHYELPQIPDRVPDAQDDDYDQFELDDD
ncbi:MAG: hypothetical protein ACU841_16570 [Gammaproteobacteria bacterium]